MHPIVPAIIPESFEILSKTLRSMAPWAHEVQVDIVDGIFVPFTSWPYQGEGDITALRTCTEEFLIEVDLMVMKPEEVVEAYLRAGVRRIVIHLESTNAIAEIRALKDRYDFRLGLSISNTTNLSILLSALQYGDYVQLMGIHDIGSQGQPFDGTVLTRIAELKRHTPDLLISIDGSVNEKTIPELLVAGADRFVSGSAILKSDNPERAFQKLTDLVRHV